MKSLVFAKRNFREILREPLSYIFCLGFPIILLVLFQIILNFTPDADLFLITNLAPGICMFSYSFTMLYMSILVSKDKSTSFLGRLFTTPLKYFNFVFGYAICGFILTIFQTFICYIISIIIGLIVGVSFNIGFLFLSIFSLIPIMTFFVFLGILFGIILNDKSAPGISSILISATGLFGGVWMPVETMGGFMTFCRVLPFYPAVSINRDIIMNNAITWNSFGINFLICIIYTSVVIIVSSLFFKRYMKKDIK